MNLILQNALHLRPGVNIKGGSEIQDFQLEQRLDNQLIELSKPVIEGKQKSVKIEMNITNECRVFASTLSYYISMYVSDDYLKIVLTNKFLFYRKYDEGGLPDGRHIDIHLKGSAGQSFCAFMAKGITCTLEGDANDYVGKFLRIKVKQASN